MTQLRAEICEWPPPPDLVEPWARLAVARQNPFITPQWVEASVAEIGEEPRILVARDGDGAARGVLPLVAGRRRGGVRTLRFPGRGSGDVFEPACAPGDEAAMMRAAAPLLASVGDWDLLEIDRMLDADALLDELRRAWPGRFRPALVATARDEVYPFLDLAEGGAEAWLAGRRRSVREDLRKRARRLERAGATIHITEDAAGLDRDFAALERLHDARWGAGSEALGGTLSRFHRRFAGAALDNGWLRLSVMELDGEPVAATYAWLLGERYMLYISGYDPAYSRQGVGSGLMFATIRAASDEGAAAYDLMRGDEAYKRRLETGRRSASSYILARPGSFAGAAAVAGARARAAGRRLPEGPRRRLRAAYDRLGRR